MPVFPDALIADTTHLSAEEFGAYFLILLATWRNNGEPFRDDDKRLARICRVGPKKWRTLRPVLVPFFDLSGAFWAQKRLKKEWDIAILNISQKSRAGRASALKRRENAATAVAAPCQRLGNGEPTTHTHTHVEEEKSSLSGAKRATKPKREIPEDWWPSEAGISFANERAGWVGEKLSEEVEHFRDHHRSRKNTFADIDAAWRNWVRTGASFAQKGGGRNGHAESRQIPVDSLRAGAAAAAANVILR